MLVIVGADICLKNCSSYSTITILATFMIKEVSGDIMLSKAQAIAHGIAPFDHFENGLALTLRQDFPAMVKDFRHWCHQSNPEPGHVWVWPSAEGKQIINLLTQEASAGHGHGGHPGHAKLQHVGHALRELKKVIEKEGIKSIALPRVATGVGGLNWDDVKPLIYSNLGDVDADIYVYETFVKGKAAAE
ncbi:MAG: macro domain-containing protein [Saprospiraceae bacterium]|nr:macro domain-containing protein [Saprospiraceae bacterium]